MSLGLGVFASVVLILAVYHKGFRKVVLWTGAVSLAVALLALACYLAYQRYTTWRADREAQEQKALIDKGVESCMLRLGTPMPSEGTTPDFFPADYFNNLKACQAYPDLGFSSLGFAPDLPSGYALDSKGKVVQLPPLPQGATYFPPKNAKPIVSKATKDTHGLEATITCDVVVYDRDKYAIGDPEAIASVHSGDSVQYLGHVTLGDQEIIRVHGRKGYVSGCVDVKQ